MVQRGDRGLVELAGPDLPDSILTFAGDGHKDLHEGYIYSQEDTFPFTPEFRPRRHAASRGGNGVTSGSHGAFQRIDALRHRQSGTDGRWRYRYDPDWPMRRDVIHMAIGLTAIGVLRLIATGSLLGGF
jgi:hypothetical protein